MQNLTARAEPERADKPRRRGCCCSRWRDSSASLNTEERKSLIVRYNKGNETSGPELPEETTTRNMQSQHLHGSEPVRAAGRKKQKRSGDPSGREESDDGDEPPRRSRNTRAAQTSSTTSAIRGLLRDFFEQQLRLDAQRQEMMERHAQERLFLEEQWRQSMRRMEQERLMLEQAWMEREEQRRMREEDRAERRDALLTSLLTRLLQGDL